MSSSSHINEQTSPIIITNNFTVNQQSNFILATVSDDNILYVNLSRMVLPSSTASTMNATNNRTSSQSMFDSKMIIPLYVVIFMLSIIGNSLVLATLIRNKRMRTVTNVYLLNLALSDLLLGVFCMPFTLVGQVLRNFIFGAAMCKLIPYFQAVSVSVGVWTLVAISLERYFAICRPLKSRRWQTQFHAYKMIAMVWLASLLWSAPVLGVSTLKAMKAKGTLDTSFHITLALFVIILLEASLLFSVKRSRSNRRTEVKGSGRKQNTIPTAGDWRTKTASVNSTSVGAVSPPAYLVSNLIPFMAAYDLLTRRCHKCREEWPSRSSEQAYNLFLDGTLLLIPLLIMSLAYSLIMSKLWKGLKREIQHNTNYQRQMLDRSCSSNETSKIDVSPSEFEAPKYYQQNNRLAPPPCNVRATGGGSVTSAAMLRKSAKPGRTTTVKMWLLKGIQQVRLPVVGQYRQYNSAKSTVKPRCELTIPSSGKSPSNGHLCSDTGDSSLDETTYHFSRHAIRSNYMDKSIEAKKKVIRMLFVVVAEFFVCWAPLHILNTWYLFYPEQVYRLVGSTGVALVQLLAYISSCCNPITYCFMNRKFRQAFLTIFSCYSCCYCCLCQESESSKMTSKSGTQRNGILKVAHNSDASGNDSTVYLGRASTIARSEVVVLEAEDRV